MRLNPATLTYLCSLLYLNEWPYKAAISNGATVEVDGLNDGNVFANCYINDPGLPQVRLRHDDLIQGLG